MTKRKATKGYISMGGQGGFPRGAAIGAEPRRREAGLSRTWQFSDCGVWNPQAQAFVV